MSKNKLSAELLNKHSEIYLKSLSKQASKEDKLKAVVSIRILHANNVFIHLPF